MAASRKKSNGKSGCLLIAVAVVLFLFVTRSVNLGVCLILLGYRIIRSIDFHHLEDVSESAMQISYTQSPPLKIRETER